MPTEKNLTRFWTEKSMCEDYKPLNMVTLQDRYPMPIYEEMFDNIGDSNIFRIVNLRLGFNQIVFVTNDRKKTTFHGSNQLWEWLVMPFALKNAHLFFQ
jgi:hypothetical protein